MLFCNYGTNDLSLFWLQIIYFGRIENNLIYDKIYETWTKLPKHHMSIAEQMEFLSIVCMETKPHVSTVQPKSHVVKILL